MGLVAFVSGCATSEDAGTTPADQLVHAPTSAAAPGLGGPVATTAPGAATAPGQDSIPTGPPLPASEHGTNDHLRPCTFNATLTGAVTASLSTTKGGFGMAAKTSYQSQGSGLDDEAINFSANGVTRFAQLILLGPPMAVFGVALTPAEIATDGSGIHIDRDIKDTAGRTSHLKLDATCP